MRILKFLVRIFYRILFKIEIEGLENIPDNEGVIIAPNHTSNFDPPLVVGFLPHSLKIMGKAELFKNKLFAWVLTKVGAFPVNRGEAVRGVYPLRSRDGPNLHWQGLCRIKSRPLTKSPEPPEDVQTGQNSCGSGDLPATAIRDLVQSAFFPGGPPS